MKSLQSISLYTITSYYYTGLTQMMLDSLLKHHNNIKIYVLYYGKIDQYYTHHMVEYIDATEFVKNQIGSIQANMGDVAQSRSCYWLKTQIFNLHPDCLNSDIVIFSDADILYYRNISDFITRCISAQPEYFWIQSDLNAKHGINHRNINAGFWAFSPKTYPIIKLYEDVSREFINIYTNLSIYRKQKLWWKYPEQTILKQLFTDNLYKFQLFDPTIISLKTPYPECLLCHYFQRHSGRMIEHYKKFIK